MKQTQFLEPVKSLCIVLLPPPNGFVFTGVCLLACLFVRQQD